MRRVIRARGTQVRVCATCARVRRHQILESVHLQTVLGIPVRRVAVRYYALCLSCRSREPLGSTLPFVPHPSQPGDTDPAALQHELADDA